MLTNIRIVETEKELKRSLIKSIQTMINNGHELSYHIDVADYRGKEIVTVTRLKSETGVIGAISDRICFNINYLGLTDIFSIYNSLIKEEQKS